MESCDGDWVVEHLKNLDMNFLVTFFIPIESVHCGVLCLVIYVLYLSRAPSGLLKKKHVVTLTITAIPLKEHGFSLHKSALHDALALRYGWSPYKLPTKCDCGNNFTVEHALHVQRGFPSIRHNEIRDITANLPTEVCSMVAEKVTF